MQTDEEITLDHTLADLAVTRAGASRVFHRHGLDFCCNGKVSLRDACSKHGLAAEDLIAEIAAEWKADEPVEPWGERALPELIDHLLEAFHAPHREELERLSQMAEKVEQVHAEKATCPKGLAANLRSLQQELELHMQKEEQVLFPMIKDGRGPMVAMPIQVMEAEHQDAGASLAKTRELATGFEPPEEACGTWRALYLGLAELERELMQHISLENNVLFPRALQG